MKFGLRWTDLAAAVLGATIVCALDRLSNHYDWARTATTMGAIFVFLLALFIWTNRRRELHNARVRAETEPGKDDQRGR